MELILGKLCSVHLTVYILFEQVIFIDDSHGLFSL